MRLLITNAYSARNKGDAAIVMGMVEALQGESGIGADEITISTADYPADADRYPWPVAPSFHSLRDILPGGPALRSALFGAAVLPTSLLWIVTWRLTHLDLPVWSPLRWLLRTYARADVVVAAGGGYLYTRSAAHGHLVLLTHLAAFLAGVLMGKPVYLYAQSIGPFAGRLQEWMVRRALSRLRLIEVREGYSRALVQGWGLRAPVLEAADAAFLMAPEISPADLGRPASDGGGAVGLTVRRWFREPARQSQYESVMTAFVDWLVRERGCRVVFVPQVTWPAAADDDREVARKVAAGVTDDRRVALVERELDAPVLKHLCGRMDLFVGTRMHSNLFALSMGVPALAIGYQPKSAGIMEALGLGDHVVPIEGLTLERLASAFDRLASRADEVRRHLDRMLPTVQASARRAAQAIAEDLTRLDGPRSETHSVGPEIARRERRDDGR